MELQLCLALPSTNPNCKGLDLNCKILESDEVNFGAKKRSFDDAFDAYNDAARTLPLLDWGDDQPNEEDDFNGVGNKCCDFPFGSGEVDEMVGWPPIKFRRKKPCYYQKRNSNGCPDCDRGRWLSNSMFVKVKMEGVAIARKIDLSRYDSFQMLKPTLFDMFGISEENRNSYQLSYQSREGEWLLAGDIPWRSFITTVQRLRVMRSSR